MARDADIKKSKFVAVTSLEATDYFDFVRSGQNLRIQQSDLLTALGVTGTLEQRGEVTATPVLQKVSTVNYIRNLYAGAGIIFSDTAQGAIQIAHNFLVDSTGVPLITDVATSQPKVKSLQAGSGITIATAGEVIQIATAAVPGSTKTVYVYQESDFPAAVLGVITLADDTEYRVQTDITTSNRFVAGAGTVLSAPNERLITLTYTGVGDMFTAVDNTFIIDSIKLSAAAGTLFNISSTTGLHDFICTNTIQVCSTLGSFDHLNLVYMRANNITCSTDGLAFSNACGTFFFDICTFSITNTGATAIDLGSATFNILTVQNTVFALADATSYAISGLASSGNINAGGFGIVAFTDNFGTGTFLNNISPYDDRWEFSLNANAINSVNLALATHGGATIAIASAATPVIIGATWVSQDMHRFTYTIGGRWTYTGKGAHVDITASISADIVTGVDNVSFFIYHNGAQITNSRVTREFDSGNIGNLSLLWNLELETNDYIELWVQNDDTNVDVIIENIILRISG